uniref:Uncharacterized protein n=1 Tax=Arundo donax TaxID=35708 RepID=A0A0A9C8U1_ARUDO
MKIMTRKVEFEDLTEVQGYLLPRS